MKLHKINSNKIKKTIICKNVTSSIINKEIKKTYMPKAGDVAIFKVKEIGKHTRIQSTTGNNKYILPGDLIMAAFGNRYATEQMEGFIPNCYHNTYHILGQGGAIGILKNMHAKFELVGPTSLSLVGYIVNENGSVINTKYLNNATTTYKSIPLNKHHKVILSLGTSMDSGKTSSAAFLARGLKLARKKIAFIKLTGTVYTKDKNMVRDYGANISLDFSYFGFPSTYMCSTEEIISLYKHLIEQVRPHNPEYIIVEIADGLLQRETHALINNKEFMSKISGALFSSLDSMSAIAGANMLTELGCNIIGVTGLFTVSPLLINEVKEKSNYTVLTKENLTSREIINTLEQNVKYLKFENKMAVNS
ncbi:hypothetical protein Lupro_12035 [Lutibacter profundi]|uniref:DUF1611 domain-containing protein n=1 Tax=Lutibacter profundi TaxID=1622118 RepID=A0A120IEK3_9FLAO|nr:hypothetical protein [Lutibacter profundi]AMC11952.1 hypothetical protein Lupro_12035 [Lutibacter profundi]